jgi:hypothetical protein
MAKILLLGGPCHGDLVTEDTRFPLFMAPEVKFGIDDDIKIQDKIISPPFYTPKDIKIFESVIRIAPYSELKRRDLNALLLATLIKEFYMPLIVKVRG